MQYRRLVLLILLLPALALAQTTYYTARQETRRPGRTLPRGSDTHTCEQARNPATARASVNGGVACLTAGDTLVVGPGTYNELLFGYYNQPTCLSGDAALQQPCAVIPNGLDADRPTKLVGAGDAVIAPQGKQPAGGGGILTLYDAGRYVHIEGLRFHGHDAPNSAQGVVLMGAQSITLHHNEIAGGAVSSDLLYAGKTSRYNVITANDIHHAGRQCDPRVQTSPPCGHGI